MAKQDDNNPGDKLAVQPAAKLRTENATATGAETRAKTGTRLIGTQLGGTPSRALRVMGVIALLAPLFVILAGVIWLAVHTWIATAGAPMSRHGYIAMSLGIGFSLLVGCGLMTLVFYSSRHGYDEPHRPGDDCA